MILNPEIYVKLQLDLRKKFLETWIVQGHYMGGKIIDTMDFEVKGNDIEGWILKYGSYLETGVKKANIPFSGTHRGSTDKSLYIEALARYAEKKLGIHPQKSLGVAFAIAYTQRREGMPTKGSYKFSQTGKRTQWIQNTLKKPDVKDIIVQFIYDNFNKYIETEIDNMILNKTTTL